MGKEIVFLGAGALAEAMIQGLVRAGEDPAGIRVLNRSHRERLQELGERYGVRAVTAPGDITAAEVVVLAVKPKDALPALRQHRGAFRSGQALLSVVAALPIERLARELPDGIFIVRAMPNTPSRIGESATGVAYPADMEPELRERVGEILRAIGAVVEVPEELLDAVTAVAGSGPAYVFFLIEAWLRAAAELGLSPDAAEGLVAQTILGAARLWVESGESPADLRRAVTSPGGTTAAALSVLEARGVDGAWVDAVRAAARRAGEMTQELTGN